MDKTGSEQFAWDYQTLYERHVQKHTDSDIPALICWQIQPWVFI